MYPEDKFAEEFKLIVETLGEKSAAKGDHVTLLYVPGTGVRIKLADKIDLTIKNPAFAQALWEVFLGAKPIDETLKAGLVGLLPQR